MIITVDIIIAAWCTLVVQNLMGSLVQRQCIFGTVLITATVLIEELMLKREKPIPLDCWS